MDNTFNQQLNNEIEKLKVGDYTSYQNFYEQTSGYLYQIISNSVQDQDVANQIMNDLYTEIYGSIGTELTDNSQFFDWAGSKAQTVTDTYVMTHNIVTGSRSNDTMKDTAIAAAANASMDVFDNTGNVVGTAAENGTSQIRYGSVGGQGGQVGFGTVAGNGGQSGMNRGAIRKSNNKIKEMLCRLKGVKLGKRFNLLHLISAILIVVVVALVSTKVFAEPDLDGTYELTKMTINGETYSENSPSVMLTIDGNKCVIFEEECRVNYSDGKIVIKYKGEVLYRGTYDKKGKTIKLRNGASSVTFKKTKSSKKNNGIHYIPAPSNIGSKFDF